MAKRKKLIFLKIKEKELYIPDRMTRLVFSSKKDFLGWLMGDGICVYISDEPNEESIYSFYAFSHDEVGIYKQKGDKL